MSSIKYCVGCKHFDISFGCANWSELTSDEPPSIECAKKHYYAEGFDIDFHHLVRRAGYCEDFEWRND